MSLFGIASFRQREGQGNSSGFTPMSCLLLLPELRPSGFLATLTDGEARTLLAVLTCLTPDGRMQATLPDLATALGISERAVKPSLSLLAARQWEGQPVLYEILREEALPYYTPSPAIVKHLAEESHREVSLPLPPPIATREEIVAVSREKYARPREEVERMVLEQLGHAPEETDDTPEGEVRRRLLGLGVTREEIGVLLTSHPLQDIINQLDWLPYRNAKNPLRFLVAAIQNRYDAPPLLRAASEDELVAEV